MRHYRRGEHGKTSLKMKRIKNIAATLHQTQSGTSHGGKCDHTQAFSNTEGPIYSDVLGSVFSQSDGDETPFVNKEIFSPAAS